VIVGINHIAHRTKAHNPQAGRQNGASYHVEPQIVAAHNGVNIPVASRQSLTKPHSFKGDLRTLRIRLSYGMRLSGFQQFVLWHRADLGSHSVALGIKNASSQRVITMSQPLIVIPARLAATRLPGKPLADIAGKPMIARVIERALLAGLGPVAVAAGEPEIVAAAQAAGAMAVLTDPDLPSGSDRIHAALAELDPEGIFDPIINLQGDMPTLNPVLIQQGLAALEDAPDAALSTLVSPSTDPADRADPNVVKAVVSWPDDGAAGATTGRCLYFTRADAPSGAGPIQRHVGLYVWRRRALARFVAAPPSPLELREKLEQLRALELGMTIVARAVDEFPKGVDTPEHLESARAWYQEQAK
jgi:3-deoxy-manno-octulosonate cytidylyltransferase (CMP-KDO synthetase)